MTPLTILTAYTPDNGGPWDKLAECALFELRLFALRHGYGLEVLRGGHGDTSRAYPWQKTAWVRDWLAAHPEAGSVWVLDIDILITNPALSLDNFTDGIHDLFIGEDINGINAGSYILRNGKFAIDWLTAVLELEGRGATSENHAMQILHADPMFAHKTKIVEGINQIPYYEYPALKDEPDICHHPSQWAPGDLLMHLPGKTPADRLAIFQSEQVQGALLP